MNKSLLLLINLFLILSSCTIEPQAIEYGKDACFYCEMTIVDKIHGAEIVTKKGKVYKFDAAECMIYHIKETNPDEIALFLTNRFNKPEELIDATNATYLISENIPSPMGAYLSAFKLKQDAESVLAKKGGKLYTWKEILAKKSK